MVVKTRQLNLGCGETILDGYENYDLYPCDGRVRKLDLNKLPLSFEDNSVDFILLSHVFEHLDVNHYDFMKEIHRILKHAGLVEIRTPVHHFCCEHTIGYMPSYYFNTICNITNNKSYKSYRFHKFSFTHNTKGGFWGNLFKCFPVLEKVIPFMNTGEYIWKLEKVV